MGINISKNPFKVFVGDIFHFMDISECYEHGDYETYEEAVAACKAMLDKCLPETCDEGKSAEELFREYVMFGEDPFVVPVPEGNVKFSARKYVMQHYEKICSRS